MLTTLSCTRTGCDFKCQGGMDMVRHLHDVHQMTYDLANICVDLQYKILKAVYQPTQDHQRFLDEFDKEMKRILNGQENTTPATATKKRNAGWTSANRSKSTG